MKRGTLVLDGWAGRRAFQVTIIGETPKRYRITTEAAEIPLPKQRSLRPGETALVPKTAVRVSHAND